MQIDANHANIIMIPCLRAPPRNYYINNTETACNCYLELQITASVYTNVNAEPYKCLLHIIGTNVAELAVEKLFTKKNGARSYGFVYNDTGDVMTP